jgi:trk system potassium uptake protein TrkH
LPFATADRSGQSFLDAWFLATSAISTSGLTVVDIGRFYSPFGQTVIMTIFQIGGLGYMAFFIFMVSLTKKNLSIRRRVVAVESVSGAAEINLFQFFKVVILATLVLEFLGALVLYFCWRGDFLTGRAVYLSVYHSISAFCTAGFSLFSDSLTSYQKNLPVNLTISVLSLLGGVGFIVLHDLREFLTRILAKKKPRRLSFHTKLVLLVTVLVIGASFITILISEPFRKLGFGDKILTVSFQTISASTTDGFNTIDIASLGPSSLFILILLMLIGAGPGSTGGGLKVSTFGVLMLAVWSYLRGKKDVNFQKRRIPDETVAKAFLILLVFIAITAFDIVVLARTEGAHFLQIVFEISSALGNTGLSMGITSALTPLGKVMITLTMFAGRVGPLTLGLSLLESRPNGDYHYAGAAVYVG